MNIEILVIVLSIIGFVGSLIGMLLSIKTLLAKLKEFSHRSNQPKSQNAL